MKEAWRSRVEWVALLAAVAGLGGGLVYALNRHPLSLGSVDWRWLAAVLALGVPLITIANAARLSLSFRLVGQSRTPASLLRASILTSAANMLPLPGGVLVRIAYLRGPDVSVRRATAVTFAVAGIWFGLAGLASGAALLALGRGLAGAVPLAAGAACAAWAAFYVQRTPGGLATGARLALLETAVFGVQALRFTWCFEALGYPATWLQGLALSVACVSGAVVSIVPAGLGVIELAATLIAPFAQLDPPTTFLATFLDRLATLLGLALIAGVLVMRGGAPAAPPASPGTRT